MKPILMKERQAVRLSVAPSKIARQLFGSATAATKVLGLHKNSFQRWDRTKRIPKSIYVYLHELDAPLLKGVKVREESLKRRPFIVPGSVVGRTNLTRHHKNMRKPAKIQNAVKEVQAQSKEGVKIEMTAVEPISRLQAYIASLEADNRRLRNTLKAVQTVIHPVAG